MDIFERTRDHVSRIATVQTQIGQVLPIKSGRMTQVASTGPPWMRNNTTTTTQSSGQGTQSGTGQGQGKGQGQGQGAGTPWWQAFDWRILLLIFGALSISFTLIFLGFESLQRRPKTKPPEK